MISLKRKSEVLKETRDEVLSVIRPQIGRKGRTLAAIGLLQGNKCDI